MIRIHRSRCIPRRIGKRAAVSMCNGILPFSRVPGYEADDPALRATDKFSILFVQIAENISALCLTYQDQIAHRDLEHPELMQMSRIQLGKRIGFVCGAALGKIYE